MIPEAHFGSPPEPPTCGKCREPLNECECAPPDIDGQLALALKAMLDTYAPNRDESDRVHLHSAVLAAIDAIAAYEKQD